MRARVEKPDRTYEWRDMGEPECGKDFCDGCGDCLACQYHDDGEWCSAGSSSLWVIYLNDPRNPYALAASRPAVDTGETL